MTELRVPLQSISSLVLTLLWLFLHLILLAFFFDITSEQSVELKWLTLNKHKRWFHSSRVKFPLVRMSASWFVVSIHLIWIFGSELIRSNNQSRATLWVLETSLICPASSLYNNLDHCFVVLKHIQQSFLMRNVDAWRNQVDLVQNIEHPFRLHLRVILITANNGSLRSIMVVSRVSKHRKQSDPTKRERESRLISILRPKRWFLILLNCVKTEVCFLHIQLIGTNVWLPKKNTKCSTRSRFWVLKISCKIGVSKKSQSALFLQYYQHYSTFFTCVMNVRYQSIQTFVNMLWSIL